jgi:elongation of very long chain fatty acids protein 6
MASNLSSFSPLDFPNKLFHTLHTIELSFDERRVIPWMRGHWHWSFYYSIAYLFLVFAGQRLMRDRKPYNLRRALCCWSAGLSLFSFYAMYRVIPIAYDMVYLGGLQHAICDTGSYIGSGGGGIWAFLFPLSKLPELVDTSFIVLRKQKMVFLHWYHHVTVFIYCWFSYAFPISTGIWFGMVNYSVHALMYAYYTVKASGRSPPKWVAKMITSVQLSQMFAGIVLNYLATKSILENKTCRTDAFAVGISIFFYASYAVLFGNFFYWTYIHKRASKNGAKTTSKTSHSVTVNGVANGLPNGYTKHSERSNGTITRRMG